MEQSVGRLERKTRTDCNLHVAVMRMLRWIRGRLVLKCGLAHLNANARDESNASANANAQQLNQMQVQMRSS